MERCDQDEHREMKYRNGGPSIQFFSVRLFRLRVCIVQPCTACETIIRTTSNISANKQSFQNLERDDQK